jgi:hypothetical protein
MGDTIEELLITLERLNQEKVKLREAKIRQDEQIAMKMVDAQIHEMEYK